MKTYQCPYCTGKFNRKELAKHIDKEHSDEIPNNYTPYRSAYDVINNKPGHGTCTECGRDTEWNEKTQKYNRLCGRKECYASVKKTYETRMLKIYNKVSLLDDPNQQEKMLANRRISGQYKWSDGTMFTYTGQFEKHLLEFLDKGLSYYSKDIITPGPVLEYKYKGITHKWITDCLILPYNLIIEVKDGGDNPNNRSMPVYREKQIAKETMITNLGTYSYLRLTNNQFDQLFNILAELKMNSINDDNNSIYRIHEELFISNTIKKLTNKILDNSNLYSFNENKLYIIDEENKIKLGTIYPEFINKEKLSKLYNSIIEFKESVSNLYKLDIIKNNNNSYDIFLNINN